MTHTLTRTILTLNPDRCVIEVTARLLGLPLARGRFQAISGELADGHSLEITVDASSLRAAALGRALRGRKGLSVKTFPVITFAADRVPAGFAGRVKVRRTECDLTLRTKRITPTDNTVILWGRGRIGRSQPRTRRLNLPAKLLGRRRLDVEIAVEFNQAEFNRMESDQVEVGR
jgi:polyisoprenoid-binding protein YceI